MVFNCIVHGVFGSVSLLFCECKMYNTHLPGPFWKVHIWDGWDCKVFIGKEKNGIGWGKKESWRTNLRQFTCDGKIPVEARL